MPVHIGRIAVLDHACRHHALSISALLEETTASVTLLQSFPSY
jgi:hypothetical protein